MIIHWISQELKSQLEDEKNLKANYGKIVAKQISKRIRQLQSFPSYAELPRSSGKHSIKDGKKFRYFTVDLSEKGRGNWRIAFIPVGDFDHANQKTITEVKILKITNETH